MNEDFFLRIMMKAWPSIPVTLIALIGIAVSFTQWKKSGKAAKLCVLAFAIVFLMQLVLPVLMTVLENSVRGNMREMQLIWGGIQFGISLLYALAFVLLMVAVFSGRNAPESVEG